MTILTITKHNIQHQVLLDDQDAELVLELHKTSKWTITKKGYVARYSYKEIPQAGDRARDSKGRLKYKKTVTKLHRLILGLTKDNPTQVDHRDRSKLNNQRSNLALVTNSQNNKNKCTSTINTSRYSGVSYRKSTHKWSARVSLSNGSIYLGYYLTPEQAAVAYIQACLMIFPIGSYQLHSRIDNNIKYLNSSLNDFLSPEEKLLNQI